MITFEVPLRFLVLWAHIFQLDDFDNPKISWKNKGNVKSLQLPLRNENAKWLYHLGMVQLSS